MNPKKRTKRTSMRMTRPVERERVVWCQGDKRVIFAAGEYRAEVCGSVVGYNRSQLVAEQMCCNAHVYNALTKASVA